MDDGSDHSSGNIYCRLNSWGECERAKIKSWVQNERPWREEAKKGGWGGLVVFTSCHKTWEMSLWLIRVNETTQNERFRSMGKVSLLKFNGRSERGRVWVHPTDDASSVGFLCLVSGRVSNANKPFKWSQYSPWKEWIIFREVINLPFCLTYQVKFDCTV